MSSDEGIMVIEWTAYDVVSLQHITLAWFSLDGRSNGPEYDHSACRAMPLVSTFTFSSSVGHLIRKSGVLGSIPSLATYFRFSFRFFKKGSCQLLGKVCARSIG